MKKLLVATLIGVICGGCGIDPHEAIENMNDAPEVSFGWHAVGGGGSKDANNARIEEHNDERK